jgi:hypothetical protein
LKGKENLSLPFQDFWGIGLWIHELLNWWSFVIQQYKTSRDIKVSHINRRTRNLKKKLLPISSWPRWCWNLWFGLQCGNILPFLYHIYFPNLCPCPHNEGWILF